MPVFEMSLEQLRQYRGSSPLPADFDAYWARALAELDALPQGGTVFGIEPATFMAPGLACFDLWFTGVGAARIHCKLVRPIRKSRHAMAAAQAARAGRPGTDASPAGMPGTLQPGMPGMPQSGMPRPGMPGTAMPQAGNPGLSGQPDNPGQPGMPGQAPLSNTPAIALFHGYTHHSGDWFDMLPYAYAGCTVLAMDVRGQGGLSEDPVNPAGPTLYGQIIRGVADPDPDRLFYRAVYLDAVQATRILMAMPGVDPDRVGTSGNSQGGALALVAAALNPRIARCAPIHPFLSDFRRMVAMDLDKGPYECFTLYFRKCDPLHEREDAFFERLGYIDVQNFAGKVHASVLWQTGLMDTICAPSTQFAAYNKLECPKEILISREYGHEKILYAADRIFSFFCGL